MNLPVVGTVGSQSKKYETGVKIKATGDTKLNDSPVYIFIYGLIKFYVNWNVTCTFIYFDRTVYRM